MNKPLVSILIPVYNTEKYVAEAIGSALNQTYKNIEIIIVDDGSTDKSWEIIESYREKYPNIIKTYKQVNKGACAARNKAFELSCGQYIQYLDADDLLAPDKIENQIKYFDGSGNDDFVVNGRWGRFKENINEKIKWGPHESIQKDLQPIEWLTCNHMSHVASWLTPRSLILKTGKWDENLAINQDGEFFERIILNSKIIRYSENARIYYRSNLSDSISRSIYKLKSIESLFNTIVRFEDRLLNIEQSERVFRALKERYLRFIFLYYPFEKRLTICAMNKVNNISLKVSLPGSPLQNKLVRFFGLKFGLKIYSVYYILRYGKISIE